MSNEFKENDKTDYGNSLDNGDEKFKVSSYGYRHQQCVVMFICFSTAYAMRACIGVALVGMIDSHHTKHITENHNFIPKIVPDSNTSTYNYPINTTEALFDDKAVYFYGNYSENMDKSRVNTSSDNVKRTNRRLLHKLLLIPPYHLFPWSKRTQDIIITSFYWGYMSLQIPAGQLVHRFGPKMLLVGAMTINCVVSFCFPWAVYFGGYMLGCFCRVLQGMSQACIIPGMFGFFGQWTHLEERSRHVGFVLGGHAIGTVLGLPITGFIAASSLGWPGIFRFYGLLSGLVALLVYFMIYDTPAKHPKISEAEKRYIADGLGLEKQKNKRKMSVPWKKILTLPALYGIVATHISQTWGQTILFAEIPSYMDKVMGVNIKKNGLLTALPFLLMWFSNFFFTWLIDWIIIKKYMSVTNARKFANSLGAIPAGIGLIVLAYAPRDLIVIESILIFICIFKICLHIGAMTSHVDIAPNFASTMMSLSNFVSNLVGSQAPLLTAYLLEDVTSVRDWRKVFFVAAGLYLVTNIIYVVLGTAEKAPWNDPPEENDTEDAPEQEPMVKTDKGKNETN